MQESFLYTKHCFDVERCILMYAKINKTVGDTRNLYTNPYQFCGKNRLVYRILGV